MARKKIYLTLIGLFLLSITTFAAGPVPGDPIYIRSTSGWNGYFAHGDEYAEYSMNGPDVKLQDPYHIQLKQQLGMMVTFADKSQFGNGDLLTAHAEWELAYWRQNAAGVESRTRTDLNSGRNDLRITEFKLQNRAGQHMTIYMIALASEDGVFVLSISPADPSVDSFVGEIAGSFQLVHHSLDQDELKKLSLAARN